MYRLSDLYKAMETLRKEGLSLNEDLEKQVSDLEENIIKKEILPIVTETIAPALKQVQRELVLVVDYVPGSPISVHLSRKRNFTADIADAKEILPDPQVEHKEIGKTGPKGEIAPATRLKITFADGHVIQEPQAAETFRKFVMEVYSGAWGKFVGQCTPARGDGNGQGSCGAADSCEQRPQG